MTKFRKNRLLKAFTLSLIAISFINILLIVLGDSELGSVSARWKDSIPGIPAILRDCHIKGNINSQGNRIYHTPESPFYYKTRIDTVRGERWFCTIEEAEDAGWRAPYEYKGPKGFFG